MGELSEEKRQELISKIESLEQKRAKRDVEKETGPPNEPDRGQLNVDVLRENQSALDTQVGGNHYKKFNIQPLKFLEANHEYLPYIEGCAIKYICRHQYKDGLEDINKAIHYLEVLKEERYGETTD